MKLFDVLARYRLTANILINIAVGGLLDEMFKLDYAFAVPDVLFHDELRGRNPELPGKGLNILELKAQVIQAPPVPEFCRTFQVPNPSLNAAGRRSLPSSLVARCTVPMLNRKRTDDGQNRT